jgi:EMC6-arch
MDVDAKLTGIHAIAGIITGYISFIIVNQSYAVILGIVILIIVGNLSERFLGKEEVGGTKGWFWSGIVPFFFVWVLVWTMLFNFF